MAERWRYAERQHPPYCTCANCKGDGHRPSHSQPSNQLRAILEKWRSKNFDPHHILGVPPGSSRKLIVEAHRRWIIAYHPDKHNNDSFANELTKHLNAARDELLGEGRRGSRSQREQRRNQEEAQQRARDAERGKQEEERAQRAREAELQRRKQVRQRAQEAERRRQEERIRRTFDRRRQEAERIWQNEEEQRSRHWTLRVRSKQRKHSRAWTNLGITLLSIIAAYLALTVIAPAEIDSMMQEWARLFN